MKFVKSSFFCSLLMTAGCQEAITATNSKIFPSDPSATGTSTNTSTNTATTGTSTNTSTNTISESGTGTTSTTSSSTSTFIDESGVAVPTVTGSLPSLLNASNFSLQVISNGASHYKWSVVSQAVQCSDADYSAWTAIDTVLTGSTGIEGNNRLCVVAKNALGAESQAFSSDYTLDTTAPTVTLSGLPNTVSSANALAATVGGVGVVEYRFKLNNQSVSCAAEDFSSETWQSIGVQISSSVASGSHRLCVIGRDAAGNVQTSPYSYDFSVSSDIAIGQVGPTKIAQYMWGIDSNIGASFCNGKLWIIDRGGHRVLMYNGIPTHGVDEPVLALGQPNTSTVGSNFGGISARSLNSPNEVVCRGNKLVVTDRGNNRILIWNSIPTQSWVPADVVIGQPDFVSSTANNGGVSASTVSMPNSAYSDGTKLFVADDANHRVLIWNSLPTSNGQAADLVLGQPDMTSNTGNNGGRTDKSLSGPTGVHFDGTKLYVGDVGNNRVLIWNTLPSENHVAASVVLGQPNFTSGTANNGGRSASTFYNPSRLSVYEEKLVVMDARNRRALIWNEIPTANQTAADVVVGQPDFISGTSNNGGLSAKSLSDWTWSIATGDDGKLIIGDMQMDRYLVWNSIPNTNFASADVIVGQSSATISMPFNGGISASVVQAPTHAVAFEGGVFVADGQNHRVLYWQNIPTSSGQAASYVLGQSDFTSKTEPVGASSSNLLTPMAISAEGSNFAIADSHHNRILFYNSLPSSNSPNASYVLGQSDFSTSSSNSGGISASTFSNPQGLFLKNNKMYVADKGNNRILIYNSLPTSNKPAADVVLGQPNFTSSTANNGGVSAQTVNQPQHVLVVGTKLVVADTNNHRVLIWNTIPTSDSQTADVVIGQPNMTSNTQNNGGISQSALNSPSGLASDGTRLWIADTGNKRVLVFNSVPTSNGASADAVLGQADFASSVEYSGGVSANSFSSPQGLHYFQNRLYISDKYRVISKDVQ